MRGKSSSRGLEHYLESIGSSISKYQEERKKRQEETEKKARGREAELARARAQGSLDEISKKLSEIKEKLAELDVRKEQEESLVLAGLNRGDEREESSDKERKFLEGEIAALEKERMQLVGVVRRFQHERTAEGPRPSRRRMPADERFDRYVAARVRRIDEFQKENK